MSEEMYQSITNMLSTTTRSLVKLFAQINQKVDSPIDEKHLNDQIERMLHQWRQGSLLDRYGQVRNIFNDLLQKMINKWKSNKQEKNIQHANREYVTATFKAIIEQLDHTCERLENEIKETKKRNLVADIYTSLRSRLISEILRCRLWPIEKYMHEEIINGVKNRISGNYTPNGVGSSMSRRFDLKENEWRSAVQAYNNVANFFRINVHDVIDCLNSKRTRNKDVHWDEKLEDYTDNYSSFYGHPPTFMNFVDSEDLGSQFTNLNECNIIERIYPSHIERIRIKYWKRLEPGEHLWLQQLDQDFWDVGVYIRKEPNDKHLIWTYTGENNQEIVANGRLFKLNPPF